MTVPYLPPELMLKIAEYSVEGATMTEYHFKKRPEAERRHLRNLSQTSCLLCHFARSLVFGKQYLCLYPPAIRRAADILSAPNISTYVRMLGFYLPTESADWFRLDYMCCAGKHFNTFFKEDVNEVMAFGDWGSHVVRLLAACAPTLRHLDVRSRTWYSPHHDNKLYMCIVEVLSNEEFPKLETLNIQTDSECEPYRFWNPAFLTKLFRRHIGGLKDISIHGYELDGEGLTGTEQDTRNLEIFLKVPWSLQKLSIRGVGPRGDGGLTVASLSVLAQSLTNLDLQNSGLNGSLSAVLGGGFSQTLENLTLRRLLLNSEQDRWSGVFRTFGGMHLKKVSVAKLSYGVNPYGFLVLPKIMNLFFSPRPGDEQALVAWQDSATLQGHIIDIEDDDYGIEWCRCTCKSGQDASRCPNALTF